VLSELERAHGLAAGTLRFEVQVETAQSVLRADGTVALPAIVAAADGRCSGLHFGTYDYSAGLGIAGAYQSMDHPAADFAKQFMQVAAAGRGVRLSDGSTNRLPVGEAVADGWAEHLRLVRRSLERGFYQGWDLHPHQLPSRFAATYAFFRESLGSAVDRLGAYVGAVEGAVLDEPATAQALATYVLRGLDCGAVDEAELAGTPGGAEAEQAGTPGGAEAEQAGTRGGAEAELAGRLGGELDRRALSRLAARAG
ncbi:DUF6986 family protein, partial [Prauserella halophila]